MPAPFGANQPDTNAPPDTPRNRTSLLVRPARPDDAPRLAEVNVEAWRRAYQGLVPAAYLETLDAERARDRWLERIVDPPRDRLCHVAEVDGVVAAYAIGGAYRTQQDAEPEDTSGWGELYAIYTHPSMQRRGAGSAVHESLLAALDGRGLTRAALWVLRDNTKAIHWYADRRWRPDGATSAWLGAGEPLDEIRLTRVLGDQIPAAPGKPRTT